MKRLSRYVGSAVAIVCAAVVGMTFLVGQNVNAAREPKTKMFSGVEQMWFCNGLYPDAGYTGCKFHYMCQDSPTSVMLDGSPAGDTLAVIGSTATGWDIGLLYFDISALPDSAVVTESRLYLKVQSFVTTNSAVYPYRVIRLLLPFDDTATWERRCTGAADTLWHDAAANDTVGVRTSAFGIANLNFPSAQLLHANAFYGSKTLCGTPIASFTDSLYDGFEANGDDANNAESELSTRHVTLWKRSGTASPAWDDVDVTQCVRNWHTGAWRNCGWRLLFGTLAAPATKNISVYSNLSTTGNRPRLLVKYMVASAASTSRRGDRSGRGTR